jgi:hypothetical protein
LLSVSRFRFARTAAKIHDRWDEAVAICVRCCDRRESPVICGDFNELSVNTGAWLRSFPKSAGFELKNWPPCKLKS